MRDPEQPSSAAGRQASNSARREDDVLRPVADVTGGARGHRPSAGQRETDVLQRVADVSGAGRGGRLLKRVTDPTLWARVLRFLVGLPTPLETVDRQVLEQVIFGYFAPLTSVRSVLFVGCDWYTRHYQRTFFRSKDYWTIDPAASARKFAGRQHIVAPLEELDRHFPPAYFDLIVCNGVYGFGLNTREQCQRAFAQCHTHLAAGRHLVLGWDDIPERTPVPLPDIESLQAFRPFVFPPLGTWRYLTDTPYRHTYDFYQR